MHSSSPFTSDTLVPPPAPRQCCHGTPQCQQYRLTTGVGGALQHHLSATQAVQIYRPVRAHYIGPLEKCMYAGLEIFVSSVPRLFLPKNRTKIKVLMRTLPQVHIHTRKHYIHFIVFLISNPSILQPRNLWSPALMSQREKENRFSYLLQTELMAHKLCAALFN